MLNAWPRRAWVVAFAVCALTLLMSGIPTGMIPSGFYYRMTPVLWWDYPIWLASAILFGLLTGSYFTGTARLVKDTGNRGIWAELVSFIAIGCPICNKIVVALIGVSGALSYFAPIQPVLGVGAVALLAWTLCVRLRGQLACPATFRRGE